MKKWVLVSIIVAGVLGVAAGIFAAIQANLISGFGNEPTPTPVARRVVGPSEFGLPVDSPVEWPRRVHQHVFLEIDGPSRTVRQIHQQGFGNLSNREVSRALLDAMGEVSVDILRRNPRALMSFGNSRMDSSRSTAALQGGFLSVELVISDHATGRVLQSTFMNFDLRTGEQFDLRAVFADDVDAEMEINRWLSMYLLEDSGARNFKGISMETQFLVDGRAQALVLKFDERTPTLAGREIVIPFAELGDGGDVIAVFNRFPNLPHDTWDLSIISVAREREIGMTREQRAVFVATFATTDGFDLARGGGAIQHRTDLNLDGMEQVDLSADEYVQVDSGADGYVQVQEGEGE